MKNSYFACALSFMLASCTHTPVENTPEIASETSSVFELNDAQIASLGLSTTRPSEEAISIELPVTGMLEAPPEKKISFTLAYGGKITQIPLINGMLVNKGKLLLEIENPEFVRMQQEYLIIQSDLELAKKELQRQKELAEANVNAKKSLEQANNQYDRLFAQWSGLAQNLRMLNFNPNELVAGKISSKARFYAEENVWVQKVHVNMGTFASPGMTLIDLIGLSQLHVKLHVFEKDMDKIALGQKISYRIANSEKRGNAQIYLIGKNVNEDRTIEVYGRLEEQSKDLRPGTFIEGTIYSVQDSALTLPSSCIMKWQGKNYVFVQLSKNKFEMRELTSVVLIGQRLVTPNALKDLAIVEKGAFQLLASVKNVSDE